MTERSNDIKMKIHTVPQDVFQGLLGADTELHSPEQLNSALKALVTRIAAIMKADLCTLYLYDSEHKALVLKASNGLNQDHIDHLIVQPGEGLTGLTLELQRPISVSDVSKNKQYKFIPGLGEEAYNSFLSIPLVYAQQPVGIMVVQNYKSTRYRKSDIELLLSLAIPAVNTIERAKFLSAMRTVTQPMSEPSTETSKVEYLIDHRMTGIAAAPGISMGRLKIIEHQYARRASVSESAGGIDDEKNRLRDAFKVVANEIRVTMDKAKEKFGPDEVSIFEAYLLFLQSEGFQNQILHEIETGLSAVAALSRVVKKYMDRMSQAGDDYIKERAYDIQDLARKISDYLLYGESRLEERFNATQDTVYLNDLWSVSDFVHLNPKYAKAMISAQGGASSHVSVMAEAMGVPAVLGLGPNCFQMRNGDYLIVDGSSGTIIVNPSPETIALYGREMNDLERQRESFAKDKDKRVLVADKVGRHVLPIGANIEMEAHVNSALNAGADEIGLYRTEFPFLIRKNLPTEQEQYELYRHVLKMMRGKEVTFRTLDIGGDKYVSYLDLPRESNPSLGWRSIRFSLERRDLFRIQLRALVRASIFGRMRLLFPMITTIEQAREVNEILDSVKKELFDEGLKLVGKIPVGWMIEVPAAVEIAGALAREGDFLSIGTNDLVQYTLAVDRTNPLVANLYDPYHPAVLKLVARTIDAAHKEGRKVNICGEIAARPTLSAFLIGVGIDSLSMSPGSIPKIKALVRALNGTEPAKLAQRVLKMSSGVEIQKELESFFREHSLSDFLPHGPGETNH